MQVQDHVYIDRQVYRHRTTHADKQTDRHKRGHTHIHRHIIRHWEGKASRRIVRIGKGRVTD